MSKKTTVKDQYDFSGATRGKFYRADAELIPPVHLHSEVLAELKSRPAVSANPCGEGAGYHRASGYIR